MARLVEEFSGICDDRRRPLLEKAVTTGPFQIIPVAMNRRDGCMRGRSRSSSSWLLDAVMTIGSTRQETEQI
jgi:hypothetical protein